MLFLSRKLAPCSIIRQTETHGVAMGVVTSLTDRGLFKGQSSGSVTCLQNLAQEADAARRGFLTLQPWEAGNSS